MPPRRPAPPPPPNGNGELSSYSRFRDRLLLTLASAVLAMMGYFVHVAQHQVDVLTAELHELREKGNGQFNATTSQLSAMTERIGGLSARLQRIEDAVLRAAPAAPTAAPR